MDAPLDAEASRGAGTGSLRSLAVLPGSAS